MFVVETVARPPKPPQCRASAASDVYKSHYPHRRFDDSHSLRARLGNSKMKRVIRSLRQQPVCGYHVFHVGRFYAYYNIVKITYVQQSDMIQRAFRQRFGSGAAVLFQQFLFK